MRIALFANRGARGQFASFAEALRGLGHEASVVSLNGGPNAPRGQYDYRDICRYSDWREPERESAHRERAKAVAAYVAEHLAVQSTDVALVWGNATCEQRAAAAACRGLGVPVAFSELGWFRRPPGACQRHPHGERTLLLDCVGLNEGRTELSLEWWDKRLTAEQEARLDKYVDWWKRTKSSKHVQHGEPLPPRLAEWRRRGLPVLLVLLQADWDAAAFYAETGVTGQADVMRLVRRAVGDDWQIVVKEHPAGMRAAQPADGELWVRDVNVHDCFAAADCVVTANSNCGLEALLYEKPVICLANAPYGRLGFTFDVRDAGALQRMLARTRWLQAPHLGNRFLRAL
ncbi:MAG: hypothetical protein ACE5JM_03885, partial [Armatimonadota bacterium]